MSKKLFILFIIAFSFKFAQLTWLKKLSDTQNPERSVSTLAIISGDTHSYLNPFKNLLNKGTYYEKKPAGNIAYAGRLPIYGIVYYLSKPFLNEENIYNVYIVLSIVLEALAIVLLSYTVFKYYWKTKMGFFVTYIIMLLSTYASSHSNYISPESTGLSILIFMIYHYHNLINNYHLKYAIYLSLFLPILVGLKPYMGVIGLFISIGLVLKFKYDIRKILFSNMILWSIFGLLIAVWTYRNYKLTDKIIPLTENKSGYFIPESRVSLWTFTANFGESSEYWNKKAMGSYFFSYQGGYFKAEDIPKTPYYNNDSIEALKNYFTNLNTETFSEIEDNLIREKIERYTSSYQNKNRIFTTFIAPIYRIKNFIFHSGSFYLPIDLNSKQTTSFQVVFKYFQSVFYYLFLFFGFLGLIFKRFYFIISIPVFLIIFFVWIIHYNEYRYFLYAYPSLILGTSVLCKEIYNVFKNKLFQNF
tara:strand:+ start:321 stop:1739 length:1419 start_codon:yes stop_codon:yes gene_type:complete